jgi:hypothetical protein
MTGLVVGQILLFLAFLIACAYPLALWMAP